MSAPDSVLRLVERFDNNLPAYKSPEYNETQVRREFIDPFFKALGWDIDNERGYAEQYKEVVHEDALRVGGAAKAPDYSFRLGGRRIFFLEAKKPAVNIKDDPAPAFQLRRYAWTAKLPLSILTDFEEFVVYDTRVRPAASDPPYTARTIYIKYEDYAERWEEIASLFSPEAIRKGALDKYAETKARKRGTATVDDAFLAEIEGWREQLARNIALRNPGLAQRELNVAVQRTIDRIIFLRICEDRGIESYGRLQALLNGANVYERLRALYDRADERYNSGLFHFQPEKDRPGAPDTLTPRLAIDDKTLKAIVRRLYYPDSPYEFSVMPADILGHVYERFLGSVIRLTAGGHAKIEQKPEVRKAGGVYYTPTYIVDYIVKHTVGKLLEGRTPQEVAGATETWRPAKGRRPLAILDPACGSGSFLLGAYQYLLDWHLEFYSRDTEKWSKGREPRIYRHHRGGWRLTTAERKSILLANIHGVDIDPQAVEVTKLSLLLKVLEEESAETLKKQLAIFHERALPDLGDNIKCGNSLIGPDFYRDRQMGLLDDEEIYRINAFDWQAEFPEIMNVGGFDVVIGNPPYIRIQTMKEWAPVEVEFYKHGYKAASKGNYDIYVVFVERALQLLNDEGRMGYILPHKFFQAKYGTPLRELIAEGKHLDEIVHFGDQQVFDGATTYTCLLFLDKGGNDNLHYVKAHDLDAWRNNGQAVEGKLQTDQLGGTEWNFVVGKGKDLFQKLDEMPVKLGEVAHLFVGLQTDADNVYILEEVKMEGRVVFCKSKETGEVHRFENVHLKRFVKGSLNIRRYHFKNPNKRLIFPYELREGKSVLINKINYQERYPLTWAYLEINRNRLSSRAKGKLEREEWYGYVYKKNHTRFSLPKILVPSIATGSCFASDIEGEFYFVGSGGGGGGGYGISTIIDNYKFHQYLLGILNSKLLSYYLKRVSTPFRGGYIALNRQYIEQLPIRTIDFGDPKDKSRHNKIVSLVELMLDLHRRLAGASTEHEKTLLERRISATDEEIDRLVYELYGLTEEEIAIVEEATR